MSFVIPGREIEAIRLHVAGAYPQEGCGILVGQDLSDERRIAYSIPTRNAEDSKQRRYAIDPEEFLAAERRARDDGLEVVGFYHSHPDREPDPSSSDRDEAWPHYSYLIVGVERGQAHAARCWRSAAGAMVSEPMRIEPRDPSEARR